MTVEVFLNSRDRSLSEAAALEAALRGEPLTALDPDLVMDQAHGDWI